MPFSGNGPPLHLVRVDFLAALNLAVGAVLERGRKRIAVLGMPPDIQGRDYTKHLAKIMRRHGLIMYDSLAKSTSGHDHERMGYQQCLRLLREKERPDRKRRGEFARAPHGKPRSGSGGKPGGAGIEMTTISNPTNGGSPIFRMKNLMIGMGAGFNAYAAGFAEGYGPGKPGTAYGHYSGGGGRIAIWRKHDHSVQAGWTVTANGGTALGGIYGTNGAPGTIVWGQLPSAGTIVIFR